jgi:hypothetical protein
VQGDDPDGRMVMLPNVTRTGPLMVKPVPVTTKVAPTGPCNGVTEIDSVVTSKVVVANCPPTSVARTAVPDVPPGTGNEHENTPVALVISEPEVQVGFTRSNEREVSEVETEKPVPCTVTGEPTGPWPGVAEIEGMVTVKLPVPFSPFASVATTAVPLVAAGTRKVHAKSPDASVERLPDVQDAIATESNEREVRVEEIVNPVPCTETSAPWGPCPGLTVIAGEVTVKGPVAVSPDPDAPTGTTNVHENAPEASAVRPPAVHAPDEIV